MKATLFVSDARYDRRLIPALERGFKRSGVQVTRVSTSARLQIPAGTDLAVFVGVKSLEIYRACKAAGVQTLLVDKGYFNRGEYFKLALDGCQPSYLSALSELDVPRDRFKLLDTPLRPRVRGGDLVIFAGGSQKFHNWHDAGDVHQHAADICAQLHRAVRGQKTIMYRPKPSWWAKIPVEDQPRHVPPGAALSTLSESLEDLLPRAQCLVTYGSNAAIEALTWGVPVIITSPPGVSPVYDIAETEVRNVLSPYYSSSGRERVMAALSWCQFTIHEMESGFAWSTIRSHARITK